MQLFRIPRAAVLSTAVVTVAMLAGMTPAAALLSGAPSAAPEGSKVDPAVTRAAEAGRESTFFVVMKEEADLTDAQRRQNDTARTRAVFNELRTTAAVSQAPIEEVLESADAEHESFWIANAIEVTSDDPELVDALAARPDVASIVPERHYKLDEGETGSDMMGGTTDAAGLAEVTPEWGVADIRADEVWSQYDVRGEGIVIGEIDSGVQYNHPALVDSYRGNQGGGTFAHDYNWFDPASVCPPNGSPCDNNGHGTHVMGTMVGKDGIGVAPGATWIAAKGCESNSCSDSSLLAAGQWMLAPTDSNGENPRPDLAPDIINNSWGGGFDGTFYAATQEAWRAAGIFAAFAAGNEGDGVTCSTTEAPGATDAAYGVGAYDSNGTIANFSGFGPSPVDGSMKPNIAAPGVSVRSAWLNGGFRVLNGTSMATPHVAGAVALLWSEAPALIGNIDGTRALLNQTARNVDDTHCGGTVEANNVWGNGKLDIMAAVDEAPHTSAVITGTVTDTSTGAGLGNISVQAVGSDITRTVITDTQGHYRLTLPAGLFAFTLSGYGYAELTESDYEVVSGNDVTKDFALTAVPQHAVTGSVLDITGTPIDGTVVRIENTPVPAVTTDRHGRFTLPAVAEGSFTLHATPAAPVKCNGVLTDELVVDGAENVTLSLPHRTDGAGTTCDPVRYDWIDGRNKVRLAGDEDATAITLPFPVSLYGASYDTANVTTNGLVNFLQPRLGDFENTALPTTARPNGIVAALWDDLVIDKRSDVETATVGRAGSREFAIVWEDAAFADDPSERVTFEAVFEEATGAVTLQYRDVGNHAVEKAASATIGLENESGTDAFQYSFDETVVANRSAVRFTPASSTGEPTESGGSGHGGEEMMVLSQAEEADLAERAKLDPYGAVTEDEPTESQSDTAADEAETPLELNVRSALEGVQGMALTVPVEGTDGDYFVLNALGNVQRRTADGETVWQRGNPSYYEDWQVRNIRPFQAEPYPVRIVMGYNAVGPFTPSSDQGHVTGDLTGDGVDDIVFSAEVGSFPFRPFTSPGSSLITGTFVTVIDGATGATLWSKLYGAARHLALVDDTLVIADSPSLNINSPAGAPARLTGLRFSGDGGALTAEEAWTYDAGTAPGMTWGSLLSLDDGLLAASWNQRKTSAATVPSGNTLVLDTADGSVKWTQTDLLYSRQLHVDASRDRLVALEQSDPNDGVEYAIVAYRLSDGSRTQLDSRINALPLDLVVGDVHGGRRSEYAVSESTLSPTLWMNANTVRSLDGDTGALLWTRTVKRAKDNARDGGGAWGLTVVDRDVVASYNDDAESESALNTANSRFARLAVLDGDSGLVRWERRGVVASQMWVQPIRDRHDWSLRTVDVDQNIWEYGLRRPSGPDVQSMQGRVWSAVNADVDGDGTEDLVVGGQSRGLWAYDGTSLTDGDPELLWETVLPGQPQRLVTADVDGDGRGELVVAADTATAVLDVRTGRVERTIDGRGQYVRSVAAQDLDGDGAEEILVPTDALRVYDHRGRLEWTYEAPESAGEVVFADVSFGDGRVYAQYLSRDAVHLTAPVAAGVALNGTDGSVAWSFDAAPPTTGGRVNGAPLQVGTFASPDIPYADGHAVVYTWQGPAVAPVNPLATFVEIRDGRTGELLHTERTGGGYTLGNFLAGPEGLIESVVGSWFTYTGDAVNRITLLSDVHKSTFATGPDGRQLVVGSGQAGLNLYDRSALTGSSFPPVVTGYNQLGAQETLVADLDGDGTDEIASLNFNEMGADRTARLFGGGVSGPYTAIRQLAVLTIDPA
jgi:subtilisin family serine protease